MASTYDEDLGSNLFFRTIQNDYSEIFLKAIYEGCILCVPRAGSLSAYAITLDDILCHVLVPSEEMPESHFRTLSGRDAKISNKTLTVEYDSEFYFNTSILFEETYYTEDLFKYKVLCVEHPLEPKSDGYNDGVLDLRTLRDCIDILWTQCSNKSCMENFDIAVKEFINNGIKRDNLSINDLKDLSESAYLKCLSIIFKDTRLKEIAASSLHNLKSLKLAVETYMHHSTYRVLFDKVSACTSKEDSHLNKIIRNSVDLQLRDLDVRPELNDLIPKARFELSKIQGFSTVLGKLGCLRKLINSLSNGNNSGGILAVDDLLPAIIFLVLKTNISNWQAQLLYIKYFHHSNTNDCSGNDDEFLVTTLEAAIEHIKSGIFLGPSVSEGQSCLSENILAQYSKDNNNALSQLFYRILKNDLNSVREIVETINNNFEFNDLLCHPLCTCDKCDLIISNNLKNTMCSVHSCDDAGVTPLHIAAMYGKPLIVDYFLTQNAIVDVKDVNGFTPLHYATARGHQNALLLLAQYGANVNALDNSLNTPLHLCSSNGHEGCVKALVYHCEHLGIRLDINAQNINGDTPLHNAAKWGYLNIVQLLIDNNADPMIFNRKRWTPFDAANNSKVWQILASSKIINKTKPMRKLLTFDFLEENPARGLIAGDLPDTTERIKRVEKLLRAVARGDRNLACFYLELDPSKINGKMCHPLCACPQCNMAKSYNKSASNSSILSVNECNFEGFTALHMAASHGRLDLLKILLRNGALIDAQTRTKLSTPLMLACQNERVQIVKCLLEWGCRIDLQDNKGNAALHHAVLQNNRHLVQALLQFKPNLQIKNNSGKTCLQEAECSLALGIVNILKEASNR